MTPSRTSDVIRQVTVLVGAAVAVVGAFVGSGALTTGSEVGDGALSADATPVAPGSPAFSIWSVIYAGLVGYAVWQALPARRADERQRRTGWLVLGSMVLNALWITVVQADVLWLSVPVIVALLVVLAVVVLRLDEVRPRGRVEAVLVDGTLGLYLGWVTVATVANVTAVLAAAGVTGLGLGADVWAVVVLAVAGLAGAGLAVRTRGRLAVGAAVTWGLAWVVVARLTDEPRSVAAAVAAAVAAGLVVAATFLARLRRPQPVTDREDAALRGNASGRTRQGR